MYSCCFGTEAQFVILLHMQCGYENIHVVTEQAGMQFHMYIPGCKFQDCSSPQTEGAKVKKERRPFHVLAQWQLMFWQVCHKISPALSLSATPIPFPRSGYCSPFCSLLYAPYLICFSSSSLVFSVLPAVLLSDLSATVLRHTELAMPLVAHMLQVDHSCFSLIT